MDKAAKSMDDARSEQVKEWKQELTSELDQSVQEMMQLAREERALEQKARNGASPEDRRSVKPDGEAERLSSESNFVRCNACFICVFEFLNRSPEYPARAVWWRQRCPKRACDHLVKRRETIHESGVRRA